MHKNKVACLTFVIFSFGHFAIAKEKRKPELRSTLPRKIAQATLVQQPAESRIFNASLWIDNLKMPITTGKVLWIDSLFVIFKGKKNLGNQDAHANVVLQIHDAKSTGIRAAIVDYDISTGWMLAEAKSAVQIPKSKLMDSQVVEIALQNEMIDAKERRELGLVLQRFEKNKIERGIAGEKGFNKILAEQMKEYAAKMTEILLKSQRKIFWKDNISMPLPLVDSCEIDAEFFERTKDNVNLKVEQAFKCEVQGSQMQRGMASALKPEYSVFTGVLHSQDAFLKIPSVTEQLSSVALGMDAETNLLMGSVGKCVAHWITEKQIFMKSCVEKNKAFDDVYNGFHLMGFYHNQKVVYKLIKTKGFSKDSQIQIIEKMIDTTRGSVL